MKDHKLRAGFLLKFNALCYPDCRARDCEFDPPLTLTKITKKEICTGSSQEKCSRVSVLYTGHVKEPGLSCVVGAPVSCTMGH